MKAHKKVVSGGFAVEVTRRRHVNLQKMKTKVKVLSF